MISIIGLLSWCLIQFQCLYWEQHFSGKVKIKSVVLQTFFSILSLTILYNENELPMFQDKIDCFIDSELVPVFIYSFAVPPLETPSFSHH